MTDQLARNRRLVWGLGGVVILIGSLAIAGACTLSTFGFSSLLSNFGNFGGEGGLLQVEALPERFMLVMANGDVERAYDLLSTYGEDNFTPEQLADLYDQYEPVFTEYETLSDFTYYSSQARTLAGATPSMTDFADAIAYEVIATIHYGEGRTAELRMIVGPQDDRWRIDTVSLTP